MGRVGHVSPLCCTFVLTSRVDADTKSKKRKAEEPPAGVKGVPNAKKISTVVVTTPAAKVPATKKPAAKPSSAVKDAKSDSSFFSAPKPKPKLPDFKKAPVVVKKEVDLNVAQPSSYDPFAEIVKSMKPRRDSPIAVATPPSANHGAVPQAPGAKSGKKKSVKWAPDGQLELVKIIERAVYDDDPADVSSLPFVSVMYCKLTLVTRSAPVRTQGMHATHSLRDLDRSEGATLIAHLFEEQIDYYESLRKQIKLSQTMIGFDEMLCCLQLSKYRLQ